MPIQAIINIYKDKAEYDKQKLIKAIDKCKTRFVILPIAYYLGKKTNHLTVAIIDDKLLHIEHFDPAENLLRYNKKYLQHTIDFMTDVFPTYKYNKLWEMCPNMGPQRNVDIWGGMCLTYSIMYIILRFLNPDETTEVILAYMNSGSQDKRISRLKKFHRFMETTIKSIRVMKPF